MHSSGLSDALAALARLGGGFGGLPWPLLLGDASATRSAHDVKPRPPHFPAKAKAVIQLFMHGGPSHVDLLDPKPMLDKYDGKPPPAEVADDEKLTGNLLKSPYKFLKYGQSGLELSEMLPQHRQARRRPRRHPVDVHRAPQPRAGAAG